MEKKIFDVCLHYSIDVYRVIEAETYQDAYELACKINLELDDIYDGYTSIAYIDEREESEGANHE